MITIRGAIGAGRGGTATHGKQGFVCCSCERYTRVLVSGFAGVAQTGSSNVPLLLYGKSTDVIKMDKRCLVAIFLFLDQMEM